MKRFNHTKAFEQAYDLYSPMVYGIAYEITPIEKQAEEIVTGTFIRLHQKNLMKHQPHSICAALIKLTIQTAREQLNRSDIRIKQFEKTPLLHQLLCEEISIENFAKENNLTLSQASKQVHEEFRLLISAKPSPVQIKLSGGKHAF